MITFMDETESQDSAPPAASKPRQSSFATLLRLWTLSDAAPAADPSMRFLTGLACAWLLLWLLIDWRAAQPEPQFQITGIPLLAWYGLAILALAAVLRSASRNNCSSAAAMLMTLALVPLPMVAASIVAPFLGDVSLLVALLAVLTYSYVLLARALRGFTGERQRRAAMAGSVFLLAFIWLTDLLQVIPDVWAAPEVEEIADSSNARVDAETLLFEQPAKIDEALAAIQSDDSSASKAYFLGFAGVGEQKVFAQEIGLASRVLSERYGMEARGLSLINDARDFERLPLASVSGLKYALRGLGERMHVERDVLFLSISSHGARDPAIAVSNADLPLNDLTEEELAEALGESGIKWRVIIISACYAGGYIESLKNPRTIVITAAAADRTSFGCSNDRDLTYFGEAFYRDALPDARSLRDAFEKAKSAIAVRERGERVEASKPQAFFGAELEAKLAAMKDHAP
jgi:Peptidase C13 family